MTCSNCQSEVSLRERKCPQCGAPLFALSGHTDLASSLESTLSARVEEQMRGLTERTQARMGKLSGGANPPREAPGVSATARSTPSSATGLEALLRPQAEEFDTATGIVLASAFIQQNGDYASKARQIKFYFTANESTFNAYALKGPMQLENGAVIRPPAVVFLGGFANAIYLVSVSVTTYLKDRLDSTLRFTYQDMGRAIVASGGRFAIEDSIRIFDRLLKFKTAELLRQEGEAAFRATRALRTSMYLYTLAHEVGHIVLGHTRGDDPNLDVSRNQEREADSFAASVLSTCPDREFHFLGGALSEALLVWVHRAAGDPAPGTHPASRERFSSFIKSNSEAAQEAAHAFGLDQRRLEGLLPL